MSRFEGKADVVVRPRDAMGHEQTHAPQQEARLVVAASAD